MNKAYHFVGDRLRDGRPVPKDNELLRFDGVPMLCRQGLHASLHPFDALMYAPGPVLCLVEVGGTIIKDTDKLVATERTIIKRFDATEMLYYFARMQAVSVVHLWDAPDVVLDYLMTGDESLRYAANDAANDAASEAANDVSRATEWDAAWSAVWSIALVASNVARYAASEAAFVAAWSAVLARAEVSNSAYAAAREARSVAGGNFLSLVNEQFEGL